MFEHVKSLAAFRQKVDFCGGTIKNVTKCGSDIDFSYELLNGRMVAVEVKKDTLKHSPSNIIKSKQWQHYRNLCRDNTYLIYATHEQSISETADIPVEALRVRYIEENGEEVKLGNVRDLPSVLSYLGSLNTYYVRVRYSTTTEYALKFPIKGKWSSPTYDCASMRFLQEDQAEKFINTRFQKDFNRAYIYEIWYIRPDGQHIKIRELKYKGE